MTNIKEIERRFGITKVEIKSPNFQKVVNWNPIGLGTDEIRITWLATDGTHRASDFNGKDEKAVEGLKTAVSELKHTVTDATWTVICKYTKRGTEIDRQVILYTERTCWKELYSVLEKFLNEQGYARFEDIIDIFLIE